MRRNNPSPFFVALFNPLNLAMLALSVAAGLCSAWWLAPVGFVLWLLMFIVVFTNPNLRMAYKLKQRDPLNQRFQAVFNRLEGVQMSLFTMLNGQSRKVRREFQTVQDATGQLVDRAYHTCVRMSVLEGHRIVTNRNRNPVTELNIIKTKMEISDDPNVKRDLEETRKTLEEQVGSMQVVSNLLDRAEAQLVNLSTTLEIKLTDVTRLTALGIDRIRAESQRLAEEIQELSNQLTEFEQEAAR